MTHPTPTQVDENFSSVTGNLAQLGAPWFAHSDGFRRDCADCEYIFTNDGGAAQNVAGRWIVASPGSNGEPERVVASLSKPQC